MPDLPGIAVAGQREDEVRDLVADAIRLYLHKLDESGDPGTDSIVVNRYTVTV